MSSAQSLLARMVIAVGAVALAACGQAPTPYPTSNHIAGAVTAITLCGTTADNVVTDCSNPPATTGGSNASGFVNRVDIYRAPSSTADRAIVFLHDAWGGTSCSIAHDLGLYANNVGPSCSLDNGLVNGNWLANNKAIAVFPQGQALTGSNFAGTATWNNWVMDSGQDDLAFLQALSIYLRANYPVTHVYLVGYSNGGMMANRVWCESPSTFDGYVTLAGPASTHYLAGDPNFGASCAPSATGSGADVKPYYGIIGGLDSILCDNSTDTGCTGGWADQTWTILTSYSSDSGFRTYQNSQLIGELTQQQVRIGFVSGCNETLGAGTPDQTPNPRNISWVNCNGLLKLQEVVNGSHWISYFPGTTSVDASSLEQASGAGVPTSAGLNTSLLDKFIIPFLNKISAP